MLLLLLLILFDFSSFLLYFHSYFIFYVRRCSHQFSLLQFCSSEVYITIHNVTWYPMQCNAIKKCIHPEIGDSFRKQNHRIKMIYTTNIYWATKSKLLYLYEKVLSKLGNRIWSHSSVKAMKFAFDTLVRFTFFWSKREWKVEVCV